MSHKAVNHLYIFMGAVDLNKNTIIFFNVFMYMSAWGYFQELYTSTAKNASRLSNGDNGSKLATVTAVGKG